MEKLVMELGSVVKMEEMNMVNKTIKQIVKENKDKEVHLYDTFGTWGELPLTENNMQHTPDAIEINDNVIKIYIG